MVVVHVLTGSGGERWGRGLLKMHVSQTRVKDEVRCATASGEVEQVVEVVPLSAFLIFLF